MPRGEGPRLVQAAILYEDGTIITGCRHHNCFATAREQDDSEENRIRTNRAEQGFVDEDGRFYGRPAALSWAIYIGQIPSERCLISRSVLTSEDLWDNDFNPVVHEDPGPDDEEWKATDWR